MNNENKEPKKELPLESSEEIDKFKKIDAFKKYMLRATKPGLEKNQRARERARINLRDRRYF